MKYIVLFALLVGCGTATAQDVTPPVTPIDTGGEVAVVEPPPEATPQEDILPPLMSEPTGAELLLPMALGATAPFPGVLLNVHGVAWLEAEPDAVQARAQAWVDRRLSQIRLLSESEIQRLQLRIRTMEAEHQIIVRSRDEQIESLTRINDQLRSGPMPVWEQVLWVAGALVVGGALGFVGGALSN